MGSDVLEIMGRVTENDNRNTISISAESREEADKLFNGLSAGGKIEMPIAECRNILRETQIYWTYFLRSGDWQRHKIFPQFV